MLVVNAGNIMKDHEWIAAQARARGGDVAVVNASSRYALHRGAGARGARRILQTLTAIDLPAIKYYWFAHRRSRRRPRDGLAHRLHGRGRVRGLRAAGAGRAGLGRAARRRPRRRHQAVRPGRARHAAPRSLRCASAAATWTSRRPCSRPGSAGSSAGRRTTSSAPSVLRAQKAGGARAQAGRRSRCATARSPGTAIRSSATASPCGVVTSGTQTPFLKKAIGLAMVPVGMTAVGTRVRDRDSRPARARPKSCPSRSTNARARPSTLDAAGRRRACIRPT